MTSPRAAIALALAAAALFGLATPASKLLLAVSDPWLLAGLLYLGSGVGLGATWLIRAAGVVGASRPAKLTPRERLWLAGAIAAGGGAGPVLLMFGLAAGSASQSALLLNLEGVFTALLAWFVFREHFDRRIASGMAMITAGAALLAWDGPGGARAGWSALLVAGACLAWALDNNLTRKVSGGDALQIATLKGVVAGPINVAIALALGSRQPGSAVLLGAGLVGLVGYGASLVLFILALRHLGAGRTAAYFSTAPFVGAATGILVLGEPVTARLIAAGALMSVGVWLHASEHHEHEHLHGPLKHEHLHWHDEHHQHEHAPGTPAAEPHTHQHTHLPLRHTHPHYPDIHHRHGH
ncbi:MAG TPA: EamA family transporter [Methylomirabilota bacterium]|nr:EamA family transporter [Methylomirabilota bacterium]